MDDESGNDDRDELRSGRGAVYRRIRTVHKLRHSILAYVNKKTLLLQHSSLIKR